MWKSCGCFRLAAPSAPKAALPPPERSRRPSGRTAAVHSLEGRRIFFSSPVATNTSGVRLAKANCFPARSVPCARVAPRASREQKHERPVAAHRKAAAGGHRRGTATAAPGISLPAPPSTDSQTHRCTQTPATAQCEDAPSSSEKAGTCTDDPGAFPPPHSFHVSLTTTQELDFCQRFFILGQIWKSVLNKQKPVKLDRHTKCASALFSLTGAEPRKPRESQRCGNALQSLGARTAGTAAYSGHTNPAVAGHTYRCGGVCCAPLTFVFFF